ncbi:hypothetical protein ACHAWF_012758 [Thalassiosira exigua]
MLRDDDLSELFARGRDRLSELAGGAEIASERTRGALAAMGISLDDEGDDDGGAARMRREALASLDRILRVEVSDGDDVLDPALRLAATARVRFGEAYDALSRAAATDPRLSSIFADVSDRTRAWREATGRLAQTRTVGVFAEGGRRLRARAAGLLEDVAAGGSGFAGAGDLTRAFAEGDAALARLKTLEVGDAVRRRLFEAIELRSESRGGLDAVIAGSLAAVCGEGQRLGTEASGLLNVGVKDGVSDRVSEDSIHSLISKLQQSATSTMSETKETLVALLSHRSAHREAVLLRLERVFMDLESQLGKDMTAEEIAQLASGAGGTMALFEPVAKRAAEEIEAQLDAVEERMRASKNWSHKADKVMEQVRKIMRGELSLSDLLDMAAGYLDEDEVVSKGGSIIVKAEGILDDLEAATARLGEAGASGAGASSSLLEAVAKAGLTKDAVLRNVEGLDVDRVLDGAAGVATDEAARRELISSAADTALDFLLKILPEMPVPPLDGVREGLVYHLSNLSMAGFKVKKEDIHIEIAGIRTAANEDGDEGEGKVDDGDSAEKPPRPQSRAAKASEILLIDIRNISATLDDAVWSFEQTYMPYLKGSGKANARLWDGDIRMSFELRRQKVEASSEASGGGDGEAWEPVLCLNDRSCSIGGVELLIQFNRKKFSFHPAALGFTTGHSAVKGTGRMAWAANKLANLLRNPLRDYVTAVIVNVLKNNSGWLIDMLNQNLAPYWDVILRTASLKLGDLPRLARHHVTKADPEERADEVELVWRERVPLGLNILTNDPSGLLKVIDLPRGTQARKVAQSRQLDPDIFKGATIVSVNGKRYGPEGQVDLFAALKDPSRPKSILFQLASSEDAEGAEAAAGGDISVPAKANGKANSANCVIEVVNIVEEGSLGLRFSGHSCLGLTVSGFCRDASDQPLPIEKAGRVATGYILSHVDDEVVLGEEGEGRRKALKLLEGASSRRPLRLGFVRPYMHEVLLKQEEANGPTFGGPSELVFVAEEGGIVLKDFALVDGAAEAGGVLVGDNLAFINGIPVGAGCRLLSSKDPSPKLDDVLRILEEHEPLALTFARAQAKPSSAVKGYLTSSPLSLNVETARTFSIPAPDHTRLGCKFVTGMNGSDVVVREMGGVVGSFQRRMKALEDLRQPTLVGCRLASVDGEDLPSYATPQLISSTLKRTWAANGRLRLTFCDEAHKEALSRLKPLTDSLQ